MSKIMKYPNVWESANSVNKSSKVAGYKKNYDKIHTSVVYKQ